MESKVVYVTKLKEPETNSFSLLYLTHFWRNLGSGVSETDFKGVLCELRTYSADSSDLLSQQCLEPFVLNVPTTNGNLRDRDQLRPYPRISCDPTHARGQLRPYPQEFYGRVNVFYLYQGSAATLPDFTVKNPTGFCTVSRSFRFKYSIPSINFSPPLATHALRPYLTTFLLSNFPPLANPCFQ